MTRRRQGQRSLEVPERRGGVQAERPLPRQLQEPQRRRLDLGRELGLAGGAREIERRRVVVREDVGQVLHALRRPRLDPPRGGHVARRS